MRRNSRRSIKWDIYMGIEREWEYKNNGNGNRKRMGIFAK